MTRISNMNNEIKTLTNLANCYQLFVSSSVKIRLPSKHIVCVLDFTAAKHMPATTDTPAEQRDNWCSLPSVIGVNLKKKKKRILQCSQEVRSKDICWFRCLNCFELFLSASGLLSKKVTVGLAEIFLRSELSIQASLFRHRYSDMFSPPANLYM